ncbi:MAG: hypothetical protein JWR51_3337 [Devosia sp.]|jgi:hypothetical protein|uniref:hypothetical protein n=1 Tax=Devosia sp. TaxID=1871048 RepID=UPI002636C049|nr:hypothetical protein [Devosia sp.]MDB5530234.1 hypothetical protein [Devosia sp.]
MSKILRIIGLLAASMFVVGSAQALDIVRMDYHDVDHWVGMPARELRATLADKTIHIDVTSRAVGSLRPLLGTGALILYTAPGGQLLWWTSKHDTIQTGRWTSTTLTEGWELPCFQFDAANGRSDCYFGGAANYKEWTAGNPFALRASAPPQVPMSSRSSLADLARKAGL